MSLFKEIKPAIRTENITYAVRDIILVANEAAKAGKELLYLNIGDPNLFGERETLPGPMLQQGHRSIEIRRQHPIAIQGNHRVDNARSELVLPSDQSIQTV